MSELFREEMPLWWRAKHWFKMHPPEWEDGVLLGFALPLVVFGLIWLFT